MKSYVARKLCCLLNAIILSGLVTNVAVAGDDDSIYWGVLNCKSGKEGNCKNIVGQKMSYSEWMRLKNTGQYKSGRLTCDDAKGDKVEEFSRIRIGTSELEQFIDMFHPRHRGQALPLRAGIAYWSGSEMPESIQYLGKYWRPGICEFLLDEGREGELTFIPGEGSWITLTATDATGNIYKTVEGALTVTRKADGSFDAIDTDGLSRTFSVMDSASKIARLTSLVTKDDPEGALSLQYDNTGKPETVTIRGRQVAKFVYDNAGRMAEVRNGRGKALVKATYTTAGELETVTRVFGGKGRHGGFDQPVRGKGKAKGGQGRRNRNLDDRIYTFTYDDTGRMTSKQRPNEATVKYAYDAEGRISSAVDGNGKAMSIRHLSDTEVEYTDRRGRVTRWEYMKGHPRDWTKKIDPLGRVIERRLDDKGRVIWQSDPCGCGQGTQYTYDDRGNVVSKSDNLGNAETFVYDENNNKTVYRDKRGNTTTYEYDSTGNLVLAAAPLGMVTTYAYDADSNLIASTNALEQTEQKIYDEAGNLIREVDPVGGVTEYTYDEYGYMSTKRDADGYLTGYTNDSDGNILKEVGPVGDLNGNGTIDEADLAVAEAAGNYLAYEYDFNSNVLSERDRNGNITNYEYDGQGKKIKTIYPDGSYEQYWNDEEGNVIKTRNRLGYYSFAEYDAAGQLIRQIDDNGDTKGEVDANDSYLQYTYNERGQIIFERDRKGNISERIYDDGGRMIKEIDAAGNFTTSEYDVNGNVTKQIDKEGYQTRYEYDANDKLVKTIDHYGNETINTYDEAGQLISKTDARGTVTAFEYDAARRMIRKISDAGTARLNIVTEYTYDGRGNQILETRDVGSLNQPHHYTYDSYGRMISMISPSGSVIEYVYDNNGNRIQQTYSDASASIMVSLDMTYDINNQMIRQVSSDGAIKAFDYDSNGNVLSEILDSGPGRLNIVNKSEYDTLGRLVRTVKDSGLESGCFNVTEHYLYDFNGNIITAVNPNGRSISATYNTLNQLVSIADTLGNTARAIYNKNGNLIEICDENGRSTFSVYDALGRVVREINQMGQAVEYTYDAAGNRLTLKDANGNVSSWTYDALGRPLTLTYPNGDVEQYQYNRLGLMTAKITPKGDMIAYAYDSGGLMTSVTTLEGTTVNSYDGLGRIVRQTSPGGNVSYGYDAQGRLANVLDEAANVTITYTYNSLGKRARMETSAGLNVLYGYDRLQRLTTVQKNGELIPATYSYDASGQRTALALPNGVTTNYEYDSASRLTSVQTVNNSSTILASFAYTLDPAGNRTNIAQTLGGVAHNLHYAFDDAYRLIGETRTNSGGTVEYQEAFVYDSVGNRVTQIKNGITFSRTYNSANQLVSETTSGVPVASRKAMTYDSLNRQLSWSNGTDIETTTYRGYTWQRAETNANGVRVRHVYDGNDVVHDVNAVTGEVIATYVTPELDQNLSMTNAMGQVFYYTHDGLGSVRTLTDASGSLVNKNDFTAFGEVYASNVVTGIANRYTYVGREESTFADIGAPMYFRWRMNHVGIGRFVAGDPSGYRNNRTGNLYVYANNNPLRFIDPTGLSSKSTDACNYCGPDVTNELVRELSKALKAWSDSFGEQATSWSTIVIYRGFTRYKDMLSRGPTLDFLAGVYATKKCPRGEGCERTYEICGECVHDHFIGNIMYGYWMRLHGFRDFSANMFAHGYQLVGQSDDGTHSGAFRLDYPYDQAGYEIARMIHDLGSPSASSICGDIMGPTFKAANKTGKDLSKCKKCPEKR